MFRSLQISTDNLQKTALKVLSLKDGNSHYHLLAASTLVAANKDIQLQKILHDGKNICDSRPLAIFLNLFREPIFQVRGTDLFRETIRISNSRDTHFILGSSPESLIRIQQAVVAINPKINVVGTSSIYFDPNTNIGLSEIIDQLMLLKPSVVWVGFGSPKQDFLAKLLANEIFANVVCVGAALDFVSGVKKEAPLFLQKLSLEWLFRLFSEPQRLGKRYVLGNLQFMLLCAKELVSLTSEKLNRMRTW